jgi:hypothetical protein
MEYSHDTKNGIISMNGAPEDIVKVLRDGHLVDPGVLAKLDQIIANQEKSLMNEAAMAEALTQIEAASTQQGESLTTLSTATENLGKDIEAFINKPVPEGGPSAEDVARAQSLAARAKSIADSLKLQADFSTALAAKTEDGAAVVIPEVPAPLPEVPASTPTEIPAV